MIPDDPVIHFGAADVGIANAAIRRGRILNSPEQLKHEERRKRLRLILRRLRYIREPRDWRPLGYEW